jgi:SulP family sulfate permease
MASCSVCRRWRSVSYIPWPVIEGFTVGIGIIIFLQQVPSALGTEGTEHPTNAILAAGALIAAALLPLAVVAAVIAIMLLLSRISGRLPASFIAIAIVTIVAQALSLPLVTIGELPASLPAPAVPSFDYDLTTLIGPAFAVAVLAAIESLLSASVASSMSDTGPYNADRELVGQGLASIASSFFGGMPATGAIARTAVNVRSGGRTRLSAVVHALALLIVVYLAAQVVAVIPLAALSGVLMATAARMVSPALIKKMMRTGRSEAAVFVITGVITVSFDLIIAVGIGIAAAAFFALHALSKASGVHREELPESPEPGAHALTELITALEKRSVTVIIKGIRSEHLDVLKRLGVISSLRHPNHLFAELDPAIEHGRSHIRRSMPASEAAQS